MPLLKPHMSETDYNKATTILQNNKTGMDVLEEEVYVPMYGYSDVEEMHDDVTLD